MNKKDNNRKTFMNDTDAERSEFLFLYDSRMANPNGDPDENRPRKDPYSGRNLVTEYRLKRTIRDYILNHFESETDNIFIRAELKQDGTLKKIEDLAEKYTTNNAKSQKTEKSQKTTQKKRVNRDDLVRAHIDVRLFGLMFLVSGIHFKKLGPVQFSIGRSLNKVQEIFIRNTRVVPTKEEGARSGTFGEKAILKYSLILFHGFLNQIAARVDRFHLTENDVMKMMTAMWHGTTELSTSSKYGQISRFLLRVIYSNENGYIGDLDNGITLVNNNDENIEDISQAKLDVSKLFSILEQHRKLIKKINLHVMKV
jgi:CRISPR-associated protein Csh2